MVDNTNFDVIIIGGSYSGLSSAMALGRSLRDVLVIDSGLPCNRQTPHSHNFLTQDGKTPAEISHIAKEQVMKYKTVRFYEGLADKAVKIQTGFEISTRSGDRFTAKKLIIASGIKDIMPDIKDFSECWGISIIHCPYCHGYEVRHEKTGILANGDTGYELGKLISNWTKDLTIYTNGISTFNEEQSFKLKQNNIQIIENEIDSFEHINGKLQNINFKDSSQTPITAIYTRLPFIQHSDIPASLGCQLTEQGHIKVDMMQKTSVPGVFACGDGASPMRSVANAVYTGAFAGAALNKELIDEEF